MAILGGRERYYQALFQRLAQNTPSAKWRGRDLTAYTNLSPEQQPALVMAVADQMPDQQPGMPTKWLLGAVVVLLARNNNYGKSGDAAINQLLDEVEAALERQPGEEVSGTGEQWHTTLGGLVHRCWISDVVVFPSAGESSEQAVALVPVTMIVVGASKRSAEAQRDAAAVVDDLTST